MKKALRGQLKISAHAATVSLLMLLVAALIAGCAGSRMSVPGTNAEHPGQNDAAAPNTIPGTEEFGLTKQGLVERIEAVEGQIAACMTAAGFEYIAVDYNTVRRGMTSDKSAPGLGERQYAARYGFGIATLYSGLPPQLADPALTPAAVGLGEQNIRIFRNLSAADQTAYNRTLFGEHADATFAVGLETEDFSRTGGCTRQAIEQLFSAEELSTTFLNPKDALIEQDPRMVAALGEFGECLRAAGFDYTYEREVEPALRRRVDEITAGQPLAALSPEAKTALAALQEEELALAVAVLDCEARILDPVESQIERELYAGYQG